MYCSAPNKQYFNNICDAMPLDNSSNISVPALSYITWGLVQDTKYRKDGIPKFTKIENGILKIGKESLNLPKLKMGY